MNSEVFYYNNRITKKFAYATMLWGIVGMLVGLIIAFQLIEPRLNLAPWLTFGRIRPLHTNAIIFAFVGNAIFMGVYHSLQRLLKTRIFSDLLSNIHFWGWQLIIVSAALTLPFGITTSKEYAELEWPIDIAIALVWVIFGLNMFGTIIKRRERHIYVGIWFYIATWVTVAMLHIVNSFELPVSFLKSYSFYSGVQDALVQWWYGHNAVAFFLTTPFLGLMYYFMPKMANRPIYSYKLSILHFWSLIFLYIWAGPHHLLYSSLPDWAQTLGVVFSVMLIAPSWGGMLNGLLTLRGCWDRVRDDVTLKFMVVALTGYGMATFEGPMLSLKTFNAVTHFTDWIVAHVHVGALAWNGGMTFAMLYFIVPKIFRTKLYSSKLANTHFWLATLGIIFYAVPMYFAGFTQGEMWKQFNADGSLTNTFLQSTERILFLHAIRGVGGLLYFTGAIVMVVNLIKTITRGSFEAEEKTEGVHFKHLEDTGHKHWHKWFEKRPIGMLVFSLVAVSIGGIVQIIPTSVVKSNIPTISSVKPYSPLELVGRDIYIREGCNSCHSQLVRPFPSETKRYGDYSKAGEFVYDHPFLWGSKRTGPDLSRGGYISNPANTYKDAVWHWRHMNNPRDINKASIMPKYDWLCVKDNAMDLSLLKEKIKAMRKLGVPYEAGYEEMAMSDLDKQAEGIVAKLKVEGIAVNNRTEIVALIAYLHKLGSYLETEKAVTVK